MSMYMRPYQKKNDKGHLIRRSKPKLWKLNTTKHVHIPELYELDLPVLLPEDRVPDRLDHRTGDLYTPDGVHINIPRPIMDVDTYTQAFEALYSLKSLPESKLVSETFYRQGVCIIVSTVYLVIANGLDADFPQFWETMVFVSSDQFELYSTRYAGRHAAYDGHKVITQTIREAQRTRRKAWAERPNRKRQL